MIKRLSSVGPYLTVLLTFIVFNYVSAKPFKPSSNESGEWGTWNKCPTDSFVTGISFKLRAQSKNPAITGVRLYCTRQNVLSEGKADFVETVIEVDRPGHPSHWGKPVFCQNGVATEFKIKHANIHEHRMVTNLRIICSDGETLKTHGIPIPTHHGHRGKDIGNWTMGSICMPRHAICGLQSRALLSDAEHGGNFLTDARVHCCEVKNPAKTCHPTDRMHHATECENAEAAVPETCGFEKKVGISYSGKEKETTIYENLGFTLNGVSTDLSSRFESLAGDSTTNFKWENATRETWLPETKTNSTVVAQPGIKMSVYQVVGYCGFYRIRSPLLKIDSSPASEPLDKKSASNYFDAKHDEHKKKHLPKTHDQSIQADFGDNDDWGDDWDSDEDMDNTGQHDVGVVSSVQANKEENKDSDESFESDWDDSEEKIEKKVDLSPPAAPSVNTKPVEVEEKKDSDEKLDDPPSAPQPADIAAPSSPEKNENHDSLEDDWNTSDSAENKPESKQNQFPTKEVHPTSDLKSSSDQFGDDDWDDSEEKKPESESKVDPPIPEASLPLSKPDKTISSSDDSWDNSEKKPESKAESLHQPDGPKHQQNLKAEPFPKTEDVKQHTNSNDDFGDDDWDHSKEKTPESPKQDETISQDIKNSNHGFGDDVRDNSDSKEIKPEHKVDSSIPAASVPKSEDPNEADMKKPDDSLEDDDWDDSESEEEKPNTKVDNEVPVAPTLVLKGDTERAAGHLEDNANTSGEKKPQIDIPAPLALPSVPHHEPSSFAFPINDNKESNNGDKFDDVNWGDSEEKTHEARVISETKQSESVNKQKQQSHEAHHNILSDKDEHDDKVSKYQPEKSVNNIHDASDSKVNQDKHLPADDLELMAKDNAYDDWGDDFEMESAEKVQAPSQPVPVLPASLPQHNHDHDAHVDSETLPNVPKPNSLITKQNLAQAPAPAVNSGFDDWGDDDFVLEIPETKFERQVEAKPADESNTGAFNNILDSVKSTAENVHKDHFAPLTDQIVAGIDDIGQAVKDIKDMPILKDASEFLDAALNPPHGSDHGHQDDDESNVKVESSTPVADGQNEVPKVQSGILGYIVGGMVAAVVIVVIVIFVLEKRQTKRYPDDSDKNAGPVRDPPLLGGYKKEVALAVGSDKDAF